MKCTHIGDADMGLDPHVHVCEDCVKTGDTWVQLRQCKICGYIGCCDSSKNRHSRKHFHETGHAVLGSAEPGQDWYWCYVDNAYVEPDGTLR